MSNRRWLMFTVPKYADLKWTEQHMQTYLSKSSSQDARLMISGDFSLLDMMKSCSFPGRGTAHGCLRFERSFKRRHSGSKPVKHSLHMWTAMVLIFVSRLRPRDTSLTKAPDLVVWWCQRCANSHSVLCPSHKSDIDVQLPFSVMPLSISVIHSV